MKERITLKHDLAENWAKAVNFIPLAGEIIIYDGIVENGVYIEFPKLKIGDGKTRLNDLPFMNLSLKEDNSSKYNYNNENLEIK